MVPRSPLARAFDILPKVIKHKKPATICNACNSNRSGLLVGSPRPKGIKFSSVYGRTVIFELPAMLADPLGPDDCPKTGGRQLFVKCFLTTLRFLVIAPMETQPNPADHSDGRRQNDADPHHSDVYRRCGQRDW